MSPSTQKWALHCNPLPGEASEWFWIVFIHDDGDDFDRPFARPPMDTFINDKLRKIAKKHLYHLIEKRCWWNRLIHLTNLYWRVMKWRIICNLHNNLQKARRSSFGSLRHLANCYLHGTSLSVDGGPISLRNLSSRFWKGRQYKCCHLCCISKRGTSLWSLWARCLKK